MAAAETIGLVAEHFVHHTVHDLQRRTATSGAELSLESSPSQLATLDLQKMLASGTTLLACGNQVAAVEHSNF